MRSKFVLGVILLTAITRCYQSNRGISNYKVHRIDSIDNFYLVYAKKNDTTYKIVSEKKLFNGGIKLRLSGSYDFKLHSSLDDIKLKDGVIHLRTPHVNCIAYNDSTFICLEGDSIRDLFYSDNLKGIYFIPR